MWKDNPLSALIHIKNRLLVSRFFYCTRAQSLPVSRVLFFHKEVMTIYLGRRLPGASSDLTRERNGPSHYSSIRSCSEWGLPSQPVTWLLVSSYLAFPPLPVPFCGHRRYLSVALSLESPPLGITSTCPAELGLSSGPAFRHSDPRSRHTHALIFIIPYFFPRGITC